MLLAIASRLCILFWITQWPSIFQRMLQVTGAGAAHKRAAAHACICWRCQCAHGIPSCKTFLLTAVYRLLS